MAESYIMQRPIATKFLGTLSGLVQLIIDQILADRDDNQVWTDIPYRDQEFGFTEEIGNIFFNASRRLAQSNIIYAKCQTELGYPLYSHGYANDVAELKDTIEDLKNTVNKYSIDLTQAVLDIDRRLNQPGNVNMNHIQQIRDNLDPLQGAHLPSFNGPSIHDDTDMNITSDPWAREVAQNVELSRQSQTTITTQPTPPTPVVRPSTLINPPLPNRPANQPKTFQPLPGRPFPNGPQVVHTSQTMSSTISSFGIHNSFEQNKHNATTKLPSGPTDFADPPAGHKKSFAKAAAAGSSGNDGFTTVGPKGKAKAKAISQSGPAGPFVVSQSKISNTISQSPKCDTQFMINYAGKGPLKGQRIESRHIQNTLKPIFAKHAPNLILRVSKYNIKGNLILTFKYGAKLDDFLKCIPYFRTFLKITDDTRIYDNVQWSKIHVTRVPTGVDLPNRNYTRFTEQDLLQELLEIDPMITRLKIAQGPRWITKTVNRHKELSSFVFAFHDPDGSLLNKVLALNWYMFGSEVTPLEWQDKPLLKGCSRCLSLEHDTEGCRNAFRCNRCGGAHATNNHNKSCTHCIKEDIPIYNRCPHPAKCVHCGGPHQSSDSTCPTKDKFRVPFAQTIARNYGVPTGSTIPVDHNLQSPIIGGTSTSMHALINVQIEPSNLEIPGVSAPINDGSIGAASFDNAQMEMEYGEPSDAMLTVADFADVIADGTLFDPPSPST
ncbi:hypothetical protein FRC09_005421 [Ceratobasidium sp. 395]|nr:hypothetical protein FRC09_005421 [Ceratobasidium sp. 395]